MAPALVLLALALLIAGTGPAGGRGVVRQQRGESLPPVVIMAAFPVLTGMFIASGIDAASVIALLIGGAVVAWRVRRTHALKTGRKQAGVLASFLGLCTGNLRAGAPMAEAMDYALANVSPVGGVTEVLGTAARRARFGSGGPAVLIDAQATDLRRLGTLWEVSEKQGIPLVRLLEQMRIRIDARERHRKATSAQLQGPQATAVILALLPLAGILMGTAMGADPIGFLTGGGLGGVLLVTGVSLVAGGFVMTQKILEGANPT